VLGGGDGGEVVIVESYVERVISARGFLTSGFGSLGKKSI
jgi:hypothetical protein